MERQSRGNSPKKRHGAKLNSYSTLREEGKRQREGTGNAKSFQRRTGSSDVCGFQEALEKAGDTVFSDRSIESQSVTPLTDFTTELADPRLSESLDHIHGSPVRGRRTTAVTDTPTMNRYLPTHWYRLPSDSPESTGVTAS